MPGVSAWSPSTSSDSSSESPAPIIVASWRVKTTTSWALARGLTFPMERVARLLAPRPVLSSRRSTTSARLRSSATASALVAAWMTPWTVCPPLSLAAYLNWIMGSMGREGGPGMRLRTQLSIGDRRGD